MRIIAPMMILIMMFSTLAGCTSQTDGVTEFEEGDVDEILGFIENSQEPEWINDRGDSTYKWQISLTDEQWLEVHSASFQMIGIVDDEQVNTRWNGYVVSEEGFLANSRYNDNSEIFGGNYSLCVEYSNLICYDYPRDSSDYSISEWSVIYRIHNVSGVNYFTNNTLSSNDNSTDDNILDLNTNISLQISYVPQGMDESDRMTSEISIELRNSEAPSHVDSFIKHIENGNYNSTIFHRIIDNFVIQGGDIEGLNGYGGYAADWYGYCDGQESNNKDTCNMNDWTLPDEADNGLTHTPGALSMAKTSMPNTGGSQFFIVPSDSMPSHLDGVHTVFGYVTVGLDSITDISEVDTNSNDKPIHDVRIESISIVEA